MRRGYRRTGNFFRSWSLYSTEAHALSISLSAFASWETAIRESACLYSSGSAERPGPDLFVCSSTQRRRSKQAEIGQFLSFACAKELPPQSGHSLAGLSEHGTPGHASVAAQHQQSSANESRCGPVRFWRRDCVAREHQSSSTPPVPLPAHVVASWRPAHSCRLSEERRQATR